MSLLEVRNLNTAFKTESGEVQVLYDVSFKVKKGKSLGIVGESGCGKSITSLSIMRLLPKPAGYVKSGEIFFNQEDVLKLPQDEVYQYRGRKISMIFQEPMTALNPVKKIGKQLSECFELHFPSMSSQERESRCLQLLKDVAMPLPEKRLNEYPHQLSGGMRQRVVIAMALACEPELIIADEPTTALDVTIQAQILDLLRKLQKEKESSLVFITHDLGVIAEISDEVVVMYCGQVVERAPVKDLFQSPKHPYTQGLLDSIPKLETTPRTELKTIEGMVPELSNLPQGCRFANRCSFVQDQCREGLIPLEEISEEREVRCLRWKELDS